MGNVLATSSEVKDLGNLGSLGATLPEPNPPTKEKSKKSKIENPGTFEELHKKCKDVQPSSFEGAKFMLNKALSNHFQISHSINLCTTQPSGYRFGATYVGSKQYNPSEAFPVLLGDIDSAGNLNANIIHQIAPRIRCRFASLIQDSKWVATQLTTDYRGSDFTASISFGNPNIFNNSGVIVAQYLQSITKNVALGAELAYQGGPNIPGRHVAVVSVVGRYAYDDTMWTGTLGPSLLHLCYYQKASEQLQIGVEVETNLRVLESVTTIAYQIDLPKANLVFRGSFDTNWVVCGVLEKRLQPLPFSFALSGRLNHFKNQFKLGCGLVIG